MSKGLRLWNQSGQRSPATVDSHGGQISWLSLWVEVLSAVVWLRSHGSQTWFTPEQKTQRKQNHLCSCGVGGKHNGPNRSLHLNCRIASQRLQDISLSLISPCKTRKPCEHTFLVWEKIALLKIGTSLLIPTPSPIHFVFAFTERYSGCVSLMVSYNIMNGVL